MPTHRFWNCNPLNFGQPQAATDRLLAMAREAGTAKLGVGFKRRNNGTGHCVVFERNHPGGAWRDPKCLEKGPFEVAADVLNGDVEFVFALKPAPRPKPKPSTGPGYRGGAIRTVSKTRVYHPYND